MKQRLKRVKSQLYHYVGGEKVVGKRQQMGGDCTGLRGDCTGLWGDCTGLIGYCTGLSGNCMGLRGNLDDCEITEADYKNCIDITDLCK